MRGGLAPEPGLCGSCRHARVIESRRGSRFFLCRLAEVDPAFPRYPRLPVLRCRGYAPAPAPAATDPGSIANPATGRRQDER